MISKCGTHACTEMPRKAARQTKGSRRYAETQRRVRQLHSQVVNRRTDFQCKVALRYAREYDDIVIEGLSLKKMKEQDKGKGLRRRISDAAWGEFFFRLQNKCEEHERQITTVDPAYTTRMCSKCGYRHDRPVVNTIFRCPLCGAVIDRPLNSALNIKERSNHAKTEVDPSI